MKRFSSVSGLRDNPVEHPGGYVEQSLERFSADVVRSGATEVPVVRSGSGVTCTVHYRRKRIDKSRGRRGASTPNAALLEVRTETGTTFTVFYDFDGETALKVAMDRAAQLTTDSVVESASP